MYLRQIRCIFDRYSVSSTDTCVQVVPQFRIHTVRMLCVGLFSLRGALRRARRRRPSGSSVVALARFWTSYIKVSSPHGRLLVLPCLPPFLHTFCTLSARRLCAAPPGSGAGLTSSQTSPRKWHYGPRPPRPCLARPSHATPALMCKKIVLTWLCAIVLSYACRWASPKTRGLRKRSAWR